MTFKITNEVLERVESLAAQGLNQQQISDVIGCSPKTLERRKKDNVAFDEAIKKGKCKGIAKVTNALFQKAINGNLGAQIFYLKNRDPSNWRDIQNVDSKVTTAEIPVNATPEEAAKIYQELLG